MSTLVLQRCFHHAQREAVARCPECGRFFCRECITEHDDRVLCASCLSRLGTPPTARARRGQALASTAGCLAAVLVLWMFFYGWGQILVSLPSAFHEGTLWQDVWQGEE